MPQLSVDENLSPVVLNAIQTILDVFAKEREERDRLLHRIKFLETEREENLQKRDVESSIDCSITKEVVNQRKRIKTEIENEDYTIYDTAKDELNAAFHSTTIDDDVVEPSQYQQYQPESNISKKNSPHYESLNEQNKENQNKCNLKANEKSPTVLSKISKKNDIKASQNENELPKWRSKVSTNNIAKRRIFENSSIQKEQPSQSKNQSNANTRKRLSLGLNTIKLKQSTLNFPRYEDETYCEGVLSRNDESKMNENSLTEETNFQSELLCLPTQYEFKIKENSAKTVDDNSIAFVKSLNEIITIEESQSTQELYKHIENIKEELRNQIPSPPGPDSNILSKNAKDVTEIQNDILVCADCDEYHRMLGRDMKKDFPKKFGVCIKHRRNIQYVDTPPGFWNPKIVDSDSDRDDTVF